MFYRQETGCKTFQKTGNMITTKIIFDRRGKATTRIPGSVEIRITHNRKSFYISTGVSVLKDEWEFGRVDNRLDADSLNERISILSQLVNREVNRCISSGFMVDVDLIRKKIGGFNETVEDVCDWMEAQLPLLGVAYGTLKHYRTLLRRVRQFDRFHS